MSDPQPTPTLAAPKPLPARAPWLIGAALMLLTILSFAPAAGAVFTFDDPVWLQENQVIRRTDGLWLIWSKPGLSLNEENYAVQYYPLTLSSYWLEYRVYSALFGEPNALDPAPYHVVNILLQGISAIVLWRVLKKLDLKAAWLIAAVWAIHPVQVESVAWAAERKNVLCSVFFFATFLAYFRFEPAFSGKEKRSWLWFAASLALFMLAVTSKATACVAPAVMLALLWWKKKLSLRSALLTLPYFVAGLSFAVLVASVEKNMAGAGGAAFTFSFAQRCMIAGLDLFFYAGKLIIPHPLVMIYPRWDLDAAWQYIFPILAAAVIAALWLFRNRIGRGPLTAVACFVIILSPALGFINFYTMILTFVADHYQHLAAVAILALLVESAANLTATRLPHNARLAIAGALLATLAALSFWNSTLWRSNVALWAHAVKHNPDSQATHGQLGYWLLTEAKDPVGAEFQYRISLKLQPNAQAHAVLAEILKDTNPAEAIEHAFESIKDPHPRPTDLMRLARLLTEANRHNEANQFYIAAARTKSDEPAIFYELGLNCVTVKNQNGAIAAFGIAVKLAPQFHDARFRLANQLTAAGKYQDAIAEYQYLLDHAPTADACINMAHALHMTGRDDLATKLRERAKQFPPANP